MTIGVLLIIGYTFVPYLINTNSDTCDLKFGKNTFHVPVEYLAPRIFWLEFLLQGIEGFPEDKVAENFMIRHEELEALVEGYQPVGSGQHKFWTAVLESENYQPRWGEDIWYGRGAAKGNRSIITGKHESGFYKLQVPRSTFWSAVRMPPNSNLEFPESDDGRGFFLGSCSDRPDEKDENLKTSCTTGMYIPDLNMRISYSVYGVNLHLADQIGEMLANKLRQWKVS